MSEVPNFIELFSGSGIMSKTAEQGFNTFTIDYNPYLNPDMVADIILDADLIIKTVRDWPLIMIWASPNCKTFSVASMGHHWTGGKGAYIPKTAECELGLKMLDQTIHIIAELRKSHPELKFAIENPRGVMRKVIDQIFAKYGVTKFNGEYRRDTVTYCQYGDNRMKPTDIWHNLFEWNPRPMCTNGDPCHEKAPRGAKTGTQGLRGNYERSILPKELCVEIVDSLLTSKKGRPSQ